MQRLLRFLFSARSIGLLGLSGAAFCLFLAAAFSTVWAPVLELDHARIGGGHFMPFTTKVLLVYCAVAFFACSAVTFDLFALQRRLAQIIGTQWKLTTALVCIVLVSSVAYIFLTFIITHVEVLGPFAERASYRHATFFGYPMLVPTPGFAREDAFTAFFLFLSGLMSSGVFLFLSLCDDRRFRSQIPGELWGMMSLGFIFLAVDELFELHLFIGRNVPLLRSLKMWGEPGTLLLGAYVAVGIAVLFTYGKKLRADRFGFASLWLGILFQLAALAVDIYGRFWRKEEALEIGMAAMFFVAVVYYAYDEIGSYIRHRMADTGTGTLQNQERQ